jgi:hypothetical protein
MVLVLAIVLLQFFLIVFSTAFIGLAILHILSDRAGVPFVRTPRVVFQKVADALEIQEGDIIYELGSGDGSFLLWCAAQYPEARLLGIERNPLLVRYANWRLKRSQLSNVTFIKQDIFHTDYSTATKLYAYLLPSLMDRLLPTLEAQFHGRLASRAFRFAKKDVSAEITLSNKAGSHGQHKLFVFEF